MSPLSPLNFQNIVRSRTCCSDSGKQFRRAFGTRLNELNFNDSTIAKLFGHGDHRSVHRYKRGTDILREAVNSLENKKPAKIVLFGAKEKALTRVSA